MRAVRNATKIASGRAFIKSSQLVRPVYCERILSRSAFHVSLLFSIGIRKCFRGDLDKFPGSGITSREAA